MKEKTNILILAAGLGKRMKSDKPKVLFDLLGKPILGYILETVEKIKNEKVVVLVGNRSELVTEFLKDKKVEIAYQKEQLGTGHAVMCAFDRFDQNSNIVVLAGDVPLITAETISKMLDKHIKEKNEITFLTMELENPSGYGRVVKEKNRKVKMIVEDKDCNQNQKKIKEVNSGVYVFKHDFLKKYLKKLSNDNSQKEYYLTDLIKIGYKEKVKVGTIKLENVLEVSGINDREQLSQIETLILNKKISTALKEGVTIKSPHTCYMEYDVVFENDVIIEPFVVIKGKSIIRKGTRISSFSTLENYETREGEFIPPFSNLKG
ncbi:MAG: sugar phosphate nucleotidyltransferase [candidate division WOR-3 bacterium]|jgi:bifunctional UDP-N-acetylglucosamine pyrophosphorylase/glucosamine-1-phosphate N-acetyltransferase